MIRKHIIKILIGNVFIWVISVAYILISLNLLYNSYHETVLFKKMGQKFMLPALSEEENFKRIIQKTHDVMVARQKIWENLYDDTKFSLINSAESHLQTVSGACGSYAIVLARTMYALGYNVRLPQMTIKGKKAGHIITEVYIDGRWIVADASFSMFFIKPDGHMASFADVSSDWNYYKKQTTENYIQDYDYEGVRYTNWEKIPVVMPLIYKALQVLLGKTKADQISLRPFLIDIYKFLFWCVTIGYVFILFNLWRQRKKFNAQIIIIENENSTEEMLEADTAQ